MGNSNMYQSAETAKNVIIDNWSLSSQPDITFVWDEKTTSLLWCVYKYSYINHFHGRQA